MSLFKSVGIIAAVGLIIACFLPWAFIPIANVNMTGMESAGTGFGKPGIMHLAMAVVFILFTALNQVWSRRFNLFVIAINTAWALRNLIIIPACHMGSCPVKQYGLYLTLLFSTLMLLSALFTKMPEGKMSNE